MGNIVMVRLPIDRLTNGTGKPAGVIESNTLMTAVESLGKSFTENKAGINAYKQVVDRGLTDINNLVNDIAELINQLTAYIEQLKDRLNKSGNNKALQDIINDLAAQKLELIAVINYAGQIIQKNNLDEVNASLTTSKDAANTLMTQITDKLTEAITRARTALGQQAPPPPPQSSSSAAGGGGGGGSGGGGGGGGSITENTLFFKNGVNGDTIAVGDVLQLLLNGKKNDTYNALQTSIRSNDRIRVQTQIKTIYDTKILGGKRTHRRARTKKSRPHKKSKKSRKINYKGGYLAKFDKNQGKGRGSHKRRRKHTL